MIGLNLVVRVSNFEKIAFEREARREGFRSMSAYVMAKLYSALPSTVAQELSQKTELPKRGFAKTTQSNSTSNRSRLPTRIVKEASLTPAPTKWDSPKRQNPGGIFERKEMQPIEKEK